VLGESRAPLCEAYDAALLDLDGVLYLGAEPVPYAAESVTQARQRGMRAAFVTNNASRRPDVVAAQLSELGIPAEPEDVVTSGQAMVRCLQARIAPRSKVLVLGTDGLAAEVADGGFVAVRKAEGAAAVVQGLAPTTAWTDLAEASVAIRAGALWVAGNTDSTYPSRRGPLPGNGAFVQALVTATGRHPVVVGKPELELHRVSVERVGATRPLVVGDRLDTDVLGAVRAGSDSLLVLTGVTDLAHLLTAPEGMRPTYVSHDLRGLLVPHEAPVVAGTSATCGSARAWYAGGQLRMSGADDQALRAACGLAWSRQPAS
jgi:HAD superfamily hydrolase (TIGR01450 family)